MGFIFSLVFDEEGVMFEDELLLFDDEFVAFDDFTEALRTSLGMHKEEFETHEFRRPACAQDGPASHRSRLHSNNMSFSQHTYGCNSVPEIAHRYRARPRIQVAGSLQLQAIPAVGLTYDALLRLAHHHCVLVPSPLVATLAAYVGLFVVLSGLGRLSRHAHTRAIITHPNADAVQSLGIQHKVLVVLQSKARIKTRPERRPQQRVNESDTSPQHVRGRHPGHFSLVQRPVLYLGFMMV